MLRKDPTTVEFAEYIAEALTTETPISEKFKRQLTPVKRPLYTQLSSLLAEIGQATEQEEIDAIVHKIRLCD